MTLVLLALLLGGPVHAEPGTETGAPSRGSVTEPYGEEMPPPISVGERPASEGRWGAANGLYRQGRYSRAAEAYRELLSREGENAALRYNLGNAYFQEGSPGGLGRAIAQYWRAYQLDPRDPDIRHNLDFALRKAGESLVPPATPAGLHALFHCLSPAELLGLRRIGWWACLLLGAAAALSPGRRPRLRPWVLGALAFSIAAASWRGLLRAAEPRAPGVVVRNMAEARSGPGDQFPVGFTAPEGRRVSILSDRGEWLEVGVLKEGLKGWIKSDSVERL